MENNGFERETGGGEIQLGNGSANESGTTTMAVEEVVAGV